MLNSYIKSKILLYLFIIPSLINLAFIINYVFSSNQNIEVYSFKHKKIWYSGIRGGSYKKIGYIYLQDGAYENYHWFRSFYDFDSMKDKKEITYTFEDGLLGVRVLKKYEFTK